MKELLDLILILVRPIKTQEGVSGLDIPTW